MIPAYQTAPGQIAGQGDTHMHRHTQSMIPAYQTAPGQIAGQGDTHMHRHTQSMIPAYQTALGQCTLSPKDSRGAYEKI